MFDGKRRGDVRANKRLVGAVLAACVVLGAAALLAVAAVTSGAPQRSARMATTDVPRGLSVYQAEVHASGQLTVTFRGDSSAGCMATARCDVQSGTMTWTVPTTDGLLISDRASGGRHRFETILDLGGDTPRASASVKRAASGGSQTCTDAVFANDAWLPVVGDPSGGLTFGLYAAHSHFPFIGTPVVGMDFLWSLVGAGPLADVPPPMHCGGPLPGDFLPLLPRQRISLDALRQGPRTIDLSGTASFAAGGLSGTVRSTIVLRVGRLQGGKVNAQRPRTSTSAQDRVITVQYQVRSVAGSVAVDVAGNPARCAAYDSCGLTGTLTIRPGPGHGQAYLVSHAPAETSWLSLRRSVGLVAGPVPQGAQAYGMAMWRSPTGSVTAHMDRAGAPACLDSSPLPVGAVGIVPVGRRATVIWGEGDPSPPEWDLLRTRCPGPSNADFPYQPALDQSALATGVIPITMLGRRTITLHLTRGVTVSGDGLLPGQGFTLRSRPDLTVVLKRTRITEQLVPSSAFET